MGSKNIGEIESRIPKSLGVYTGTSALMADISPW